MSETYVTLPAECPACGEADYRKLGQRFKFKTAVGDRRLVTVIHSYECNHCGHVWTQMEQQTRPPSSG
jgi:predicted RNA-binding Zn-ribbon protein involved in translation (DUF1610 family)